MPAIFSKILRKAHECRCCATSGIFMERHIEGDHLLFSLLCPKCSFSVAMRANIHDAAGQAEAAGTVSHIFDRATRRR